MKPSGEPDTLFSIRKVSTSDLYIYRIRRSAIPNIDFGSSLYQPSNNRFFSLNEYISEDADRPKAVVTNPNTNFN